MIYHITHGQLWQQAEKTGSYVNPSLETEGFIHFSTLDQVLGAANRYYRNVQDLLVIQVDERRLEAKLIWENTTGGSEPFPHVYGPLNLDAVIAKTPLLRDKNGEFMSVNFDVT